LWLLDFNYTSFDEIRLLKEHADAPLRGVSAPTKSNKRKTRRPTKLVFSSLLSAHLSRTKRKD